MSIMTDLRALRALAASALTAVLFTGCTFVNLDSSVREASRGALVITEIQTANAGTRIDMYGETPSWFELRNGSAEAVELSRFSVTDDPGKRDKWSLPAGTLPPGGIVLIFASGRDSGELPGELHASFKLSREERVLCVYSGSALVDRADFGILRDGLSWVRESAGSFLPCLEPTPGEANPEMPAVIRFSLPPGFYRTSEYPEGLRISLESALPIRYTTDGSEPTAASSLYDGNPIAVPPPDGALGGLPSALVIKAALERGGAVTGSLCRTYVLDGDSNLAVFSISTDPDNLWSEESGIFAEPNLYADLEHRAHVEYFDEGGALALEMDAGLTGYGSASRSFAQKSMALYARSIYGGGSVKYDFFGKKNSLGGPIDSFEALILRNSGNDWDNTMIRDSFMTSLLGGDYVGDGLNVDYQASRPVAVYLNGAYWGFYTLREKINESYLEDNHPETARSDYDLIANYYETLSGDLASYQGLLDFLGTHTLSDDANMTLLSRMMDVDEFIDYQIFNIYVDNEDWPGNNIKYWRPRSELGKWRWIAFDTDFGYGLVDYWRGRPAGSYDTLQFALMSDGTEWPNPAESTYLLRSLMANAGFRSRFYRRCDELLSGRFAAGRARSMLDALESAVEDEILSRHLLRWRNEMWPRDGQEGYRETTAAAAELRAAAWRDNIGRMREFALNRPGIMRSFYTGWDTGVAPVRGNGTGLLGHYYGNPDLAGVPRTRVDSQVNFDWTGDGLEVPGVPGHDAFSVRWTGELESSFTGPVRLFLTVDDSGSLVFDGQRIITWDYQDGVRAANVEMTAGVRYPVTIEYYQGGGEAVIRFEWSQGFFRETVPQSQLYPE